MNEWKDFEVQSGVLTAYHGPGGDVILPEGVTAIGEEAFEGCQSLTGVTIPEGVREIGQSAFEGCENLRRVTLPSSLERLWSAAFRHCDSLEEITIPELDGFGDSVFEFCRRLERVTFLEGTGEGELLCVNTDAFRGCERLRSITLPKKVWQIASGAFRDCESLVEVQIPEGAERIEANAFSGCRRLERVTFPAELKTIEKEAFLHCGALTGVELPDGVTSIGDDAFRGCARLERLRLPAGLEDRNLWSFRGCAALADEAGFVILNHTLSGYFGPGGDVAVPDSVRYIGARAFAWCERLRRVTLPEGLVSIGPSAFYRCEQLSEVTLPEGLEHLGNFAFSGCKALRILTIPERTDRLPPSFVSGDTAVFLSDPERLDPSLRPNAAAGFAERGGGREDPCFPAYERYLRENAGLLVEMSMAHPALLSLLCRERLIPPEHLERYAEAARESGDPSRVAAVLDYTRAVSGADEAAFWSALEERRERVYRRRLARQGRRDAKGLIFFVTGMPMVLPDPEAWKAVFRLAGASLASELTEDVDYVVRCFGSENLDQLRKAESLGIEILSERGVFEVLRCLFWVEGTNLIRYLGENPDVTIPPNITSIAGGAFHGRDLRTVTIPASVVDIHPRAFEHEILFTIRAPRDSTGATFAKMHGIGLEEI